MRVVVADAGPLNYLVVTGDIALLPKLFGAVLVPTTVREELTDDDTPEMVRAWIVNPPAWLEIHPDPASGDADEARGLDAGERAAIALAIAVKADMVLMDDQDGVAIARRMGLNVTGTLGVLDLAARQGLVDLAAAFDRLKATSFYYRQALLDELMARHANKNRDS
jgi:predicted nucleic acid-binding protein